MVWNRIILCIILNCCGWVRFSWWSICVKKCLDLFTKTFGKWTKDTYIINLKHVMHRKTGSFVLMEKEVKWKRRYLQSTIFPMIEIHLLKETRVITFLDGTWRFWDFISVECRSAEVRDMEKLLMSHTQRRMLFQYHIEPKIFKFKYICILHSLKHI